MGTKYSTLIQPQTQTHQGLTLDSTSSTLIKSHEEIMMKSNNKCNYNCPVCKKSGKTPNLAGRFFLINDNECKCNACYAVFPKSQFYKTVIDNVEPL